jgi:hypothetical protein
MSTTATPTFTTFLPVMRIVRLVSEKDGNIYIGPFSTEADADAWLENMPQDDDLMDAYVEAMAPPTLPNGEPNY